MYHAKIDVVLRKSILDPQGKAVEHGIHSLGMKGVEHVRIGKHIEFDIHVKSAEEAEKITREACDRLLANPVMEDYTFTIEKLEKPVHA